MTAVRGVSLASLSRKVRIPLQSQADYKTTKFPLFPTEVLSACIVPIVTSNIDTSTRE